MTQNKSMNSLIELPEWHLIQSIRYSLPRATYATSDTIASIRGLWPQLSSATRRVILKDIKEALERNTCMQSIDQYNWRKLFTELQEHE